MNTKGILLCILSLSLSVSLYAKKPVKVACIGNSITAQAEGYPLQLQKMLGEGYEVKNFGQNSTTVQMHGRDKDDATEKYAYRKQTKYAEVKDYNPDVIIMKLGTNDSKECNWLEDSPTLFRKDLKTMVEELLALPSHPKIYLCYPIRVKRSDWTINEKNIHAIIPIIKSVADEYQLDVINLHTIFEKEKGDQWDKLYIDGVHPNPEGAGIIAKYIYQALINQDYNQPEKVYHHYEVLITRYDAPAEVWESETLPIGKTIKFNKP